jgi:hypothetical protein
LTANDARASGAAGAIGKSECSDSGCPSGSGSWPRPGSRSRAADAASRRISTGLAPNDPGTGHAVRGSRSPEEAGVELMTGFGLATAAGLNAYIPMLLMGLLGRFTHLITLPHGWSWLENGWVMTIIGVLLAIEIVADKIPALDSVNDTVQTFVRPTAGGIVFGSGTAAQTAAVTDPADFARTGQWVPIAIGVVTALVVHLTKTSIRPAANVATAGVAAPVLSTLEDFTSVGLTFIAILIPALVLIALIGLVWGAVSLLRRRNAARP